MPTDPLNSPSSPESVAPDTRCIRTGCDGIVRATWSIGKGTVYQCEKCKGCGKGSNISASSHDESRPASSPPDIAGAQTEDFEKLLDELEAVAVKLAKGGAPSGWMTVANRYTAARSKLENLFRQQQEEIERLKAENAQVIQADDDFMIALRESYKSELASLKKEQLTPEQAQALLDGVGGNNYRKWAAAHDRVKEISALRSISITPE